MAQRSKIKLFSKGDQLIAIHDVKDLHQGDRVNVWDICDSCLGLMLEDHPEHYNDVDFEKWTEEKFVRVDPTLIDKQKVVNVFHDLLKLIALNMEDGQIPAESMARAIKHNIIVLDLQKEIVVPTNQPK